MYIKTTPGQTYVLTCNENTYVDAYPEGHCLTRLLNHVANTQSTFVAISEETWVESKSAIITPVFKGASLGMSSAGGSRKQFYQFVENNTQGVNVELTPPPGYRVASGELILGSASENGYLCNGIIDFDFERDDPRIPNPKLSAYSHSIMTFEGCRLVGTLRTRVWGDIPTFVIQYPIEPIPANAPTPVTRQTYQSPYV